MLSQLINSIFLQAGLVLVLIITLLVLRNTFLILLLAATIPFTTLTLSISAFYLTISEFLALSIVIKILLRSNISNFSQTPRYGLKNIKRMNLRGIQKSRLKSSRLVFAVISFLSANLFILIQNFDAFALVQFLQRVLYVGGGIIIGYGIYRLKIFEEVIYAWLFGATLVSIMYIIGYHPFGFAIMQKNVAGLIFGISACCTLYFFQTKTRYRVLFIWFLFSIFMSQSRNALLGIILVIFVYILKANSRKLSLLVSSTLAVILFWVLFTSQETRSYLIFWDRDLYGRYDSPVETRFLLTQQAISLWRDSPIFGHGFTRSTLNGISTHNVLTQSILDGGIVLGAMTLLLFFVASTFVYRFSHGRTGVFVASVWTITLLHGLLDSYWTRNRVLFIWMLIGFCLAYAKGISVNRVHKDSTSR